MLRGLVDCFDCVCIALQNTPTHYSFQAFRLAIPISGAEAGAGGRTLLVNPSPFPDLLFSAPQLNQFLTPPTRIHQFSYLFILRTHFIPSSIIIGLVDSPYRLPFYLTVGQELAMIYCQLKSTPTSYLRRDGFFYTRCERYGSFKIAHGYYDGPSDKNYSDAPYGATNNRHSQIVWNIVLCQLATG